MGRRPAANDGGRVGDATTGRERGWCRQAPRMARDLPAGGRRLLQKADGYAATIVNGEVTYRDGVATGVLPGRLLRAGR